MRFFIVKRDPSCKAGESFFSIFRAVFINFSLFFTQISKFLVSFDFFRKFRTFSRKCLASFMHRFLRLLNLFSNKPGLQSLTAIHFPPTFDLTKPFLHSHGNWPPSAILTQASGHFPLSSRYRLQLQFVKQLRLSAFGSSQV